MDPSSSNLKSEFRDLFQKLLGKLDTAYTIKPKREAEPACTHAPQKFAHPLLPKVKQTDRMLNEGVSHFYCSGIIVVPKQNGSICLCADLTQLNKSVQPEVHPMTSVDKSLTKLARSKIFSKLSFSSRWHRSARKCPYALRLVSQQSPQGCPRNSANIRLVEHRSLSILEGGMSAASFLYSSFLQAINAVMLWPVHVQIIPEASEHLCPAKLQTRCDICCACQSVCPFIPTDSGVPTTVDPQKFL